MSVQLHQTMRTSQFCIRKDDTVVQPEAVFKLTEVNRWDFEHFHLWPYSRWLNVFDSISDVNCPNNLVYPAMYKWPEIDQPPAGARWIQLYRIQGITKNASGTPVGDVIVRLFRTSTNELVDSRLSDAAGNYQLYTPYSDAHYVTGYKGSSPDISGHTVNTLIGVAL